MERQLVEGDHDRSAAIYVAVISALIAGGHSNHNPWQPVTYIDATARSSAGPVAVSQVVTRPIPVEVQERLRAGLAAHTEVRFVEDPQSVIQPDSRVQDHGVLITLAPVPPTGRPLEIGARSHLGNLGSNSVTFIVDEIDAQWQVTGTTGVYAAS
jgi:hypothetical protein